MKGQSSGGCSRRQFLQYSATAGAMAALQWKSMLMAAPAVHAGPYGMVSPALTKFIAPIRNIGTDIPVMSSDGLAPVTGVQHYTINIGQYTDVLHPDLLKLAGYTGTKLRGYGQGGTHKHLGGVIIAQRNIPLQITFNNDLPPGQIIPNDTTIPQPTAQRSDRTAVHLHGGHVHWISDGGPFDWWSPGPNMVTGESFFNNVLNPGALPGQAEYYYPNDQSARFLWYHDHAWGITRTNAYSGIASAYVIVDPVAEVAFDATNGGVPSAIDIGSTLNFNLFYLVFQDKIFFGADPPADYGANAGPGDLFYAYSYDPALFGPPDEPSFGQTLQSPPPIPSCVPEFFGDTILANGTSYPTLEVEARPIRIRMLNACNARFLNPRLVATAGQKFPDSAEPGNSLGPGFIQIGTEGGYLPFAVPLSGQNNSRLLLAPAERADILIDFSKVKAGKEFILYNDAPGPYPGGAGIFDYYPKNHKTPWSTPGFGPNTRTLLKIRVKAASGTVTPLPKTIDTAIANLGDPLLVTQTPGVPTPIPGSIQWNGGTVPVASVRTLTLNEGFDEYGRLAQFVGANFQAPDTEADFYGWPYLETPTEVVVRGSVEVWQIANLTADTHPIHFHLSNVQILYRQAIQTKGFAGTLLPTGQPIAPDLNELGFKETVRMNPGEVTVVIMKFDIPADPPNVTVPPSTRTGITGAEYVVHCHILEHEEHDMMRPLIVTG